MGQVLWETRALDPRYRRPTRRQPLPRAKLTPDRWPEVPESSSDEAFNRWYQAAAYVVGALRSVGSAKGVPVVEDLRYEERLALALVIQLLEEPEVREALGLAAKPPRHALAIEA